MIEALFAIVLIACFASITFVFVALGIMLMRDMR